MIRFHGHLQLVNRVSQVLRLLSSHNRTGLRLVDIISAASIERSTAHRLLQSLIAEGMVAQDRLSKRYFLGIAIYEMGVAVPSQRLRDACLPFVQKLANATADTVFLSVRSGFDGICVHRQEGSYPIAYVLEAGRRRPLSIGSSNLAILSCLPKDEISRIRQENWPRLRRDFPSVTQQSIQHRIDVAQTLGFVFADVMEREGTIKSMAMAIRDGKGRPIASIGLSALVARWTPRRTKQVKAAMTHAVQSIQQELAVQGLTLPAP